MPPAHRAVRRLRSLGTAALAACVIAGASLCAGSSTASVAVAAPQQPAPSTDATQRPASNSSDSSAEGDTDGPADDAGQSTAPSGEIVVASAEPVLDPKARDYEFDVLVRSTGEDPLPAGDVRLRLDVARAQSLDALDEPFSRYSVVIASEPVSETPAGDEQLLAVTVPRDDIPLLSASPEGVYRVQAVYSPEGSVPTDFGEPTEDGSEPTGDPAGDAGADAGTDTGADADSDAGPGADAGSMTEADASAETQGGRSDTAEGAADPGPASSGDAATVGETAVVWRGVGKRAAVDLSTIVPFVLPNQVTSMPSARQLETFTPAWQRLLDDAVAANATAAIDPRIIAGIRAYGANAAESSREFLADLETAPLESFLLQFSDADPAAQADLGLETLLQPVGLDYVTRFGEFPVEDTATPADETDEETPADGIDDETEDGAEEAPGTATDGADPGNGAPAADSSGGTAGTGDGADSTDADSTDADGNIDNTDTDSTGTDDGASTDSDDTDAAGADEPPALEELLAWPNGTPTAWPSDVDHETLALLRASGIERVVLDSASVEHTGGPLVELGRMSGTVTDAALDDAAAHALTAGTDTERSAAFSELVTRLALAAQSDAPSAVVALDRSAVAQTEDTGDPALLLERLLEYDWVQPSYTSSQRAGTAHMKNRRAERANADASAADDDYSSERLDALDAALKREQSVVRVGRVLVHPEYLSGYQRARLLTLFSARYADTGQGFADAVEAFRERDAEMLGGVSAIPTDMTQLVGTNTELPLQLHNALPFDAEVDVTITPASAAVRVPQARFERVPVAAEANEQVLVPVHARISSAESGLIITVTSVDGTLTAFTGTQPLLIRATFETVGIRVLGGVTVILIVFGAWRSIRRRRKPRAAQAE